VKEGNFKSFTHQIPYYAYHKGVTLLTDGSLFTSIKLQGLDSYSMTSSNLEALKSQIKNIFEHLPEGYTIQFLHDFHSNNENHIFDLETKLISNNPISQEFKNSYLERLKSDSNLKNVDLYAFIISTDKNKKDISEMLSLPAKFLKRFKKNEAQSKETNLVTHFEKRSKELLAHTNHVLNALKSQMAMEGTMLPEEELYSLIYKFLNPTKIFPQAKNVYSKSVHQNYFSNFVTMREYLTHTPVEEFSDKLLLGDKMVKVLTLKLPSRFTQEFDSDVILNSLDFPFFWSFNFSIIDTVKKNSELELKQKRKHAFLATSTNPNISSTLAKSEIEQALVDQKTEGFSWYETSLSFLICADNEESLKENSNKLISVFRDFQESVIVEEKYAQKNYFLASLPGCGHLNERRFLFSSLNVADLVPVSTPPTGTQGLSCYLNTFRNTLFKFSTFSDEFNSWNQVVIGKIGSGKSFIVNNILNLSLMSIEHPRVMILDLGHSFKRTTELWGGDYVTLDLDHPDCGLNPLPPHDNIRSGDDLVMGLLDFTVELLLLMTGINHENKLHARVIRKGLLQTYKLCPDRDPILSDLRSTLLNYKNISEDSSDLEIASFTAKLLEDFTEGQYSRIFNRHSTLNFKSDFFCFDFKDAHSNERIREIATYVIGGYMCRKMTENPEPKFIIFDEFATTMKHATGAALCRLIAKNCRKHGVSFICISQELEDFLHNPAAQAVYHQANFKWFLKMDDDLKKYQDHLKLTVHDIEITNSLRTEKGEFAEVYLMYGDKKAMLALRPDALLYWACTTDPRDKLMEIAYNKSFSDESFLQILKRLAKKYPKGVTTIDLHTDSIVMSESKGEKSCVA